MVGISFKNWSELRPSDENLNLLTQLGGCIVTGEDGETVDYKWLDNGICDVADFEKMIAELSLKSSEHVL